MSKQDVGAEWYCPTCREWVPVGKQCKFGFYQASHYDIRTATPTPPESSAARQSQEVDGDTGGLL